MADISTLIDNFNDNSLNGTLWGTYVAGSSTVAETGQNIVITPAASTIGSEGQLYSQASYSLTGSNIYLNFVTGAAQSVDTYVHLQLDGNNVFGFIWNAGTLYAYTRIAAVEVYRNSATVAAGAGTWLRMRESGGTIYWDYSTDSMGNWTNLDSRTNPFAVTALALLCGTYEWGSSATPGTTVVDNVNYTPSSSYTVSVSDSVSMFATVSATGGTTTVLAWEGLGMNIFSTSDNIEYAPDSVFDGFCDAVIMSGFTKIRAGAETYIYPDAIAHTQAATLRAMARGLDVTWGIGAGGTTLTAANWSTFAAAVEVAAQWAQDNGIYEFQLANEEEYHIDGTTLTTTQVIENLKTLATTCQGIYTIGDITYSTSPDFYYNWISAGKGDIDAIGGNQYLTFGVLDYDPDTDDAQFVQWLNDMVAEFGPSGFFLSEWQVSSSATANFSANEATVASKVADLLGYIEASGVTRAYYFEYYDDSRPFGPTGFGARKTTGEYYQLWDSLVDTVPSSVLLSVVDSFSIGESVTINVSGGGTNAAAIGEDLLISESVSATTSILETYSPFYRRPQGTLGVRL